MSSGNDKIDKTEAPREDAPECQGGTEYTPAPLYRRNTVYGILCYLGPLLVIPVFTQRRSDFIRFHENQGLVLLISGAVLWVCGYMPDAGFIFRMLLCAFYPIMVILGIINVVNEKMKKLPLIGGIDILGRGSGS
ncbi:MAG: hypothetical protein ACOX6J_02120 [Oscillospiraceae bacterium]|jgi:uncharacterized membrane protein